MSFELTKSKVFLKNHLVPFSEAHISIASAPVLYGLSVYSVMPVMWNKDHQQLYLFRVADHFKRLQNSAKIMGFDYFLQKWSFEEFQQTVLDLLKENQVSEDVLVRMSVFVDEILSGTTTHGLKHELAMFIYPAPHMLPTTGSSVCISSWMRTPDNAIPSRAKINGSYANASLMKNEAQKRGYDDAISMDIHGHIAEGTVANIFMVKDGLLITPSASTDILEGISRDSILTLAMQHGQKCLQRSIDRSELYLAEEVFFSGSSVGVAPIISIDDRLIGSGKPGQYTLGMRDQLSKMMRGEDQNHQSWLTPLSTNKTAPPTISHQV